ncbi:MULTISPECIES: peptidoglycan editing factor PgeF [unclassified Photobacterium]|uniref:peptidoglycan editing factor PgeF n=1 Tax=unclassified Photobacterium TaxID=2628852 RepID=UPI001EDCE7CA|nr:MULTISPECIES: peptidoglycan editing factor PgeF [unclassified Photobacterium]MCG3865702.1 peptidoglycan editing factor PgeF [Photobacterium sp. Ph6]MCG3877203.1 peptidoglycan editing factor PgeF [Photobacterium sp. Ph5]
MKVIIPNWPASKHVRAISTTRLGGVSTAPYHELNLGLHVGDDEAVVNQNRELLKQHCDLVDSPAWLNQIHSADVIELNAELLSVPDADGSFTRIPGLACAIMTADCLPVLFCDKQGTEVAAVHAGWRGLATGVIEHAVEKFHCNAADIMAWLGPAIGPNAFEVGGEVREQFMAADPNAEDAFIPHGEKWLADLYLLAKQRLNRLGITAVYGGEYCTFTDKQQFYSYRRQAVTGRQASLIWLADNK